VLVEITADEADGRRDWAAWFEPFFAFLARHPGIKAFHYINSDWKDNRTAASNGWMDGDISHNAYIAKRYAEELRDPMFIHRGSLALLNGWFEPAGRAAREQPPAGNATR